MRHTFLRRYQGIIFGLSMLLTVLLASACAGVPTNTTTTTGTSNNTSTTTATSTTSGSTPVANQPTTTQQATTFEPGSIQFTGQVTSITASSIAVQMPDGPLTMSLTSQTDLSHFNGGRPTNGQIVNVDALASNSGFTATKIEQADQKDQAKQNSVQYRGVTRSAVGTDNNLRLGVGDKTWNFTINSTTNLKNFNNNAQSIQANQRLKVDVQFNGTSGTVLKVDTDNGNN
jgi:hypothetical protein